MIWGNLTSVLEGDETPYSQLKENIKIFEDYKPSSGISKLLKRLSRYGMNYDDQVYKNMMAIPADKLYQNKQDVMMVNNMYSGLMNNWKIKPEEDKSFAEKTLDQKRDILRKMAMQPELEDILDIMANECIVYDDESVYIGQPYIDSAVLQTLQEKSSKAFSNCLDTGFYKLYMLLDWKDNAWDTFKRWLVDGVLAYEIVYDNNENPHTIIGIIELDPGTLTKKFDKGMIYWIQFEGVLGQERKLLDSQIIYIKYEDSGVSARQSYLERLIRPFNIYRIIEQAQVIWTVTQSSFKTMFTIPVAGMNRAKGTQTLQSAMARYREDISFNNETGELKVNGRTNLPFNKEYWMPENENGKPEIETLVDQGPSLNDSDQLRYFLSKLYKMSKIPESRFDKEAQSTWFGTDPSQSLRDEINFGRFVDRMRNAFIEILLKPLRIYLALNLPGIKNDKRLLNAVGFRFNSYNQFEEMMNIEVSTKRIEYISLLKDTFMTTDSEGNETPYFSLKFLIQRFLGFSDADLELNEKCKLEDAVQKKQLENDEEEETEDMDNEESGESDEGSEGDEGDSLDDEMLGDVQPESSETTQA
ncbi:MAG: portal protein [Erysipelotrichales bacterium]|nr:portal protein [Erysipelotrichales bacterium]